MGGCISSDAQRTTTETRRPNQQKTPVLLFYLPGPIRDSLMRCVQSEVPNLRFVDAQNHRKARRYWINELVGKRDYAAVFYVADLRDHPALLLNARTLNWFLRSALKTHEVRVVAMYNESSQLDEFKSYLPQGVEPLPVCEREPETVKKYVTLLQTIESKFADPRKTQTTTALL